MEQTIQEGFYKVTYGRYGTYKILSYFKVESSLIIKVDTFHKRISCIKHRTFDLTYQRNKKEQINEQEFTEALLSISDTPITRHFSAQQQ